MWITMNFSFAFILDISNTNPRDVKVMNSTGIYKLRKYQLTGRLQKETWKQHSSILQNVCLSDAVTPIKNMVFYSLQSQMQKIRQKCCSSSCTARSNEPADFNKKLSG
jgi:hypothetical protein